MRVLIADDNVDLAEALATVLRSRGVEPTVVANGDVALQLARHDQFDAAVVDLLLPGTSGVEVLERLREAKAGPVLVAMTGYDRAQDRARLNDLGIGAPLRKPFPIPILLARLGLSDGVAKLPRNSRIALVVGEEGGPASRPGGCTVDRFADPEMLREAVAEHPYDAAVVLTTGHDTAELIEDLKALDRDLAVITDTSRDILSCAIERTRERRETTRGHHLLQAMFEQCLDPTLLITGEPPLVELANRELLALVGLQADQIRGAPLHQLDDPESDEPGLVHGVAEVLAGSDEVRRRVSVRVRGGTSQEMRARFVRLADDQPAVAVTLDPYDDRAAHEQALQTLGATAAGVAHEMRNALAGIGSSLGVLRNRISAESREGQVLSRVADRVDRAAEVMTDLLAYARPSTPRLKVVPLRMVLEAAADQVRAQAPEGVTIIVEQDDRTLRVRMDPVGIQLALLNLGLNAVQAITETGTVIFGGRLDGDCVVLRVSDDGPGVPAAMAEKIFEPFFTTRARGSGLGLANVRKVVEAHGGRVELTPRQPGAHFVLRLPLRPRSEERS